MDDHPLASVEIYSRYVAKVVARESIVRSTISVLSASPYTGTAEGEVFLRDGFRLRLREELDFDDTLITAYGYEVYHDQEKLYWYDDFPHPNDPTLASTHPHHKHVPPNIKRNRIPATGFCHSQPNLLKLILEIEQLEQKSPNGTTA